MAEDITLTDDELAALEEHVQYVSYKGTVSYDYQTASRELCVNKPPNISVEKCNKYVKNQVNYYLSKDLEGLKKISSIVRGIK